MEKFLQYDSVQLTTFYKTGKVTYRRGVITDIDYDDAVCVFVATCNSTFDKNTYGIIIVEETEFFTSGIPKYEIGCMMSCRIVLIEKWYKNKLCK